MRLLYLKPRLKDLSQGSRIAFIRQFRFMSQNDVSEKLGLTGECKRRTMTRHEKGNRNPKDLRTLEIANILKVDVNSIRQYDFKSLIDIIYTLLWLEELIPNYKVDLDKVQITNNEDINKLKNFVNEWEDVRDKKNNHEISYEYYIEWKLNYLNDMNNELSNSIYNKEENTNEKGIFLTRFIVTKDNAIEFIENNTEYNNVRSDTELIVDIYI